MALQRMKVRWRPNDIQEGKSYRVLLCQGQDQYRYYTLFSIDDPNHVQRDPDAYFETEEVEHEVLKTCNPNRIMRATVLTNGQRFGMDGHGVWLSEFELADENWPPFLRKTDDKKWSTPVPPKRAPR